MKKEPYKNIQTVFELELQYKKNIIELIEDLDMFNSDLDYDGIECINHDVSQMLDILNGVYQDVITGKAHKHTMVLDYCDENGNLKYEYER